MAPIERSSDDLTVEDRAMSIAYAAYRAAMLPRDGDEPEACMWAAVHAVRDVYEAEVERLREAAGAANQAMRDYNRNGITWLELDAAFARLEAVLHG